MKGNIIDVYLQMILLISPAL